MRRLFADTVLRRDKPQFVRHQLNVDPGSDPR